MTTGVGSLTLQLTRARFAVRQGETLLYFASIFANTISTAIALTIAGGTHALFLRWRQPPTEFAQLLAAEPNFRLVLMFYFVLGLIATALLLPAMASLAASAAVLGARGREQRLSALRLIGLSSGDVTRMALLDSLIQATIGIAVGAAVHTATVPLWSHLELEGLAFGATELYLPWWLAFAVVALILVVALVATWWGLRQVRISPLGVARRAAGPRLTWARAVVALAVLAAIFFGLPHLKLGREWGQYVVTAGTGLLLVMVYNLAGPWLLQALASLYAKLPGTAQLLAARRVQANPRETWRRVGGLGFLALIAGYIATMPIQFSEQGSPESQTFQQAASWDFSKGVAIMLAAGLVLTAAAVLISQAAAVFERADLTRALDRLGTPTGFHARVQVLEVLGPLLLSLTVGYAFGTLLAIPMTQLADKYGLDPTLTSPAVMIGILVGGLAATALALIAVQPLQRQVLTKQVRRND